MPQRPFLTCLVLFGLTAISYLPALNLDFVEYDDDIYVSRNSIVQNGLTWPGIQYAFQTYDSGNWIPLTWLSLMLDVTLFGARPGPIHATNVALHAFNVCLLFSWLNRISGATGRSFAVAALFAVHPLHVESVAWVAERKDVLSTFFFLLMLLAYDRYCRSPRLDRYLAVLLLFGFGLLSKSMLVTAPLLLWLLDFFPASHWDQSASDPIAPYPVRNVRVMVLEKLPALVLSVVVGLITIQAQGFGPSTAIIKVSQLPMEYRIGNAVCAYMWYVMKTLLPTGLCAMYSHPMKNVSWNWTCASAAAFLAITAFWIRRRQNATASLFGWIWFLTALLPVIGILQVGLQAYADRYAYIPQIGLGIALVWEAKYWLNFLSNAHRVEIGLGGLLLVVFGSLTFVQIGYWKDTRTLWQRALQLDPNNWAVHRRVGWLEFAANRFGPALDHFEKAIATNPDLTDVHNNIGWIYQSRGDSVGAQNAYERALTLSPGYESAIYNLVDLLKKERRVADAVQQLERYLHRRPNDSKMRNELGLIFARAGDLKVARLHFAIAIKSAPDDDIIRTNLGLALLKLGELSEGRTHLEHVVTHQPNNPAARVNLGIALQVLNAVDDAAKQFEIAVRLNPDDAEANERLEQIKQATR